MEEYNDKIQLKDLLIKLSEYKVFLLSKKKKIISFSFLFLMIGVGFAFFDNKQYNATLTFVVESDQGGGALGAMSGIASQFGFDLGGAESSTFSQSNVIELLKSRGVIVSTLMQKAKVDSKTDLLIEHYFEINKIKEIWADNNLKGVTFHDKGSYQHDSISGGIWREIIQDNLTIELASESNGANIITLSYTSLNEEFAKVFVEKLIDEMGEMYIAHQTAQANNTLNFLQDRADSVFTELEIAEQAFAKTKDINQRIVKASGRLKELQLMRRVEVLNTMYLEIVKNRELSKITLLNKMPIINIIDKPILPLEVDTLSIKKSAFLGGFLGAFLSICFFVFIKLFKDTLEES